MEIQTEDRMVVVRTKSDKFPVPGTGVEETVTLVTCSICCGWERSGQGILYPSLTAAGLIASTIVRSSSSFASSSHFFSSLLPLFVQRD